MTKIEAEQEAKKRAWSPYIRTHSRTPDVVIEELLAFVEAHGQLDKRDVANGQTPLLLPDLPPGKKGPTGAISATQKAASCIRKGCAQDPLPVDQM